MYQMNPEHLLTTKVCWAILSFIWGSVNLWRNRTQEPDSQQWTFGQVIAIVLLVVPVIALIEGYFRRESTLLSGTPAVFGNENLN
jgi:uncharacterized membrane protein SpoIIM required for sporulation